jgi:hypothetical protein
MNAFVTNETRPQQTLAQTGMRFGFRPKDLEADPRIEAICKAKLALDLAITARKGPPIVKEDLERIREEFGVADLRTRSINDIVNAIGHGRRYLATLKPRAFAKLKPISLPPRLPQENHARTDEPPLRRA